MKILFVKKLYSPVGGSEALVYQWAQRLSARGHEVRVLSLWPLRRRHNFPPGDHFVESRHHYRRFEHEGVAVYQLAPRLGPAGKLVDLLPFSALIRTDLALGLAGGCDLVHNVCREYAGAALSIARHWNVPLLLTPLPHPGQPFSGDSSADAALYRIANGIVAMTRHEKRWYQSLGVSGDRVAVIGAGATVTSGGDAESFRSRHGIVGPIVLFVGRKEPYKGYLAIMAAAARVWKFHPETHFVFIGENGLLSRWYERRFRRDRRIVNLAVVGDSEKADAYAACDVFCMPSTHESFGLTYLEAWSYGKPVVGCNVAAVREVISHRVNGLLVKQAADEIAQAVIQLVSDRTLARQLGEAGRRKVVTVFDWQLIMSKLENFYATTLSS